MVFPLSVKVTLVAAGAVPRSCGRVVVTTSPSVAGYEMTSVLVFVTSVGGESNVLVNLLWTSAGAGVAGIAGLGVGVGAVVDCCEVKSWLDPMVI